MAGGGEKTQKQVQFLCPKMNLYNKVQFLGLIITTVIFSSSYFTRYPSSSEPHLVNCPDPAIIPTASSIRAPSGLKVLVTGAAGFIGSHVAKDCSDLGLEVVALDDLSGGFRKNIPQEVRFVVGDLKDASFVSNLVEKEKFDIIYHLAAYAAEGLSHFIRNYNYQNNLIATTNLITQAVRVGSVKKFVFTSSIAVYGAGRTPMTEDMEPLPEDPYGISKLACEYDLKAAHEMFGLDYVIFRPHNVYGPGQNMYDKYRNVVGIFLNQLQAGKDLTVFGNGKQTRKFSYISDVSFPIALSGIASHVRNEIFNVGGDIATTVNELAKVTSDAWGGTDAKVIHLDSRNEVAHAESDHKKLTCFFPGLPKPVGLREGMAMMVQWAKETGKYFKPVEFEAVELKKNLPPSWDSPNLQEVPAFQHDARDNSVEKELSQQHTQKTTAYKINHRLSFSESGGVYMRDSLPHLPNCDMPQSSLSLRQLANKYQPSKFFRYAHTNFDRIYPEYLEKYRTKKFRMLEIGLDTGSGSLLWKEYFPCAELYGLEYDASKTGSDGARIITAILGDQSNQTFLETDFLAKADGKPFDVIVDDGGHHYEHQVTSYKVLFDKALKPGGLYLMEDIETSYHKTGSLMYGRAITRGGQSETKTVINQFKQLVDVVNKKFFDNSFTVFGPVDHWIATVGFMSNLIILTKKDKSHCFAEMQYVWPERLADDCPAAQQPIEVIKSSPMVEYCGDHIVRRDKGYLRRDEPSLNLEWVMDAYSSDN